MTTGGTATVTLPADAQILIAREVDAPPHLEFVPNERIVSTEVFEGMPGGEP